MARKRMVTRTIKVTVVTVLGLSSESESARSVHYTIPGVFTKVTDGKIDFDYDKLLKVVKKRYDSEDFTNVKVVNAKQYAKLYGIPEEEFIRVAKELYPKSFSEIALADTTED